MSKSEHLDYDYIIIGSGFGGAVSALRLAEKGYRVLVLEKGQWKSAKDFPKSNWNLKRWLWLPLLRFFGFFRITFFRHVGILSGVGVGGGSLVYANTLPVPKESFFTADSWAHLANWKTELEEHYSTALKMLGAAENTQLEYGDKALRTLAESLGKTDDFEPTNVAVFFGEPEKTVPDPYFGGKGPDREGCRFCGGCMVGCRFNAKNTLDKNYLYLAQQEGAEIQAESEVTSVIPLDGDRGQTGYRIQWKQSTSYFPEKSELTARGVIFSGGVLGTVKLLLELKESTLPHLSNRTGGAIRTNSESLVGVTCTDSETDFSQGIAIGSILHTDKWSHLEPVRYSSGSGFWRLLMSPLVHGKNVLIRLGRVLADFIRHPVKNLQTYFVWDWAKRTQILLYMRTLNSTLRLRRGWFRMKSSLEEGESPTAFMPEAKTLSDQ